MGGPEISSTFQRAVDANFTCTAILLSAYPLRRSILAHGGAVPSSIGREGQRVAEPLQPGENFPGAREDRSRSHRSRAHLPSHKAPTQILYPVRIIPSIKNCSDTSEPANRRRVLVTRSTLSYMSHYQERASEHTSGTAAIGGRVVTRTQSAAGPQGSIASPCQP